jgi:hypothetical protein
METLPAELIKMQNKINMLIPVLVIKQGNFLVLQTLIGLSTDKNTTYA